MSDLIQFSMGGDKPLIVEVKDVEGEDQLEFVSNDPGQRARQARQSFQEALENLQPMVNTLQQKLSALNQPADEVEVKFGIKLSGQVGAILTTVGGEMNYEVTLKWNGK